MRFGVIVEVSRVDEARLVLDAGEDHRRVGGHTGSFSGSGRRYVGHGASGRRGRRGRGRRRGRGHRLHFLGRFRRGRRGLVLHITCNSQLIQSVASLLQVWQHCDVILDLVAFIQARPSHQHRSP